MAVEVTPEEYDAALDACEEVLRELGKRLDEPVRDEYLNALGLAQQIKGVSRKPGKNVLPTVSSGKRRSGLHTRKPAAGADFRSNV
jgi:hypothetical protein